MLYYNQELDKFYKELKEMEMKKEKQKEEERKKVFDSTFKKIGQQLAEILMDGERLDDVEKMTKEVFAKISEGMVEKITERRMADAEKSQDNFQSKIKEE